MTSEIRFYSIVFGLTGTILFCTFAYLIPNLLPHLSGEYASYFSFILSLLTSAGTYATIAKVLSTSMRNSVFIKKIVLGPCYLEGTWAGYV